MSGKDHWEEAKANPWVMPEWMEPFRELIAGHGGNGVENLMNRLRTEKNLAFTNSIVLAMALQVDAQVGLLHRLHSAGILETFLHQEEVQNATKV